MTGNLLSPEDCRRAADDVALVYHLAAGTGKSFPGCVLDSAVATRNLLDAVAGSASLRRFVNVRSFSVYSNYTLRRGAVLDESCPVERAYTRAFRRICLREDSSRTTLSSPTGETVVSRTRFSGPESSSAPGGRAASSGVAASIRSASSCTSPAVIQSRSPTWTTAREAIVMAGLADGVDAEVFNVVDDDLPSSTALVRLVKRNLGRFFSRQGALPAVLPVLLRLGALRRLVAGAAAAGVQPAHVRGVPQGQSVLQREAEADRRMDADGAHGRGADSLLSST